VGFAVKVLVAIHYSVLAARNDIALVLQQKTGVLINLSTVKPLELSFFVLSAVSFACVYAFQS